MKMKMKTYIYALIIMALPLLANSQPTDSTIRNVVARIDTTRIHGIIKDLSGENPVTIEGKEYVINNRDYKSPLNAIAAKYVYYKFKEYGYEPHFSSIPYPSSTIKVDMETIYAVKIGKTKPNEIIVFAASHDSKVNAKDSLGPGANENASGLSVVLEASRIFKNIGTERTIIFVSFDDWANTGFGNYLLDSLIQSLNSRLIGMGLDQIGYYGDKPIALMCTDTNNSKGLVGNFFNIANIIEYPYPLISRNKFTPFYKFALNGYDEVYFVRDFPPFPPYIGKTDVFSNLDLPFLHANARLAIGTLAYVAGIIGESLSVEYDRKTESELVFPNPVDDYINSKHFLGFSFKIFNLLGECIERGFVASEEINLSQIPAGCYYIVFSNGESNITTMFVKR